MKANFKKGWVIIPEWWVIMKRNGGSSWCGIYSIEELKLHFRLYNSFPVSLIIVP